MPDRDAPAGRFTLGVFRNWLHPTKDGSGRMSFQSTLWAWKQEDISSTQKLVLLDICDRANADKQCWPKQKTIADRVCLTERAVCSALAALQRKNLIRRTPRIKFGKRTSDVITILIADAEPEAAPIARNAAPKPPRPSDASAIPPNENGSGDRQKHVQSGTGTTFSVISNTETPRLDLARVSSSVELMPQPGRPDIDGHNAAVWFLAQLRQQIAADIDWSSGGIDDCRLLIEWLRRHGDDAVAATITATVVRRRQIQPHDKIQSWSYFESEIAKLGTGGGNANSSGGFAKIA